MYYAATMEHPIRAWCLRQDPPVTLGAFARRLDISRIHLGRLMRGDGNFKLDLFQRIEAVTGGELKSLEMIAHFQTQQELRSARMKLAEAS